MTSQTTCADCGKAGQFLVTVDGASRYLCDRCTDRTAGGIQVSQLISHTQSPRLLTHVCPFCQTTVQQVQASGLAGCPLCYEALPATVWEEFGVIFPHGL